MGSLCSSDPAEYNGSPLSLAHTHSSEEMNLMIFGGESSGKTTLHRQLCESCGRPINPTDYPHFATLLKMNTVIAIKRLNRLKEKQSYRNMIAASSQQSVHSASASASLSVSKESLHNRKHSVSYIKRKDLYDDLLHYQYSRVSQYSKHELSDFLDSQPELTPPLHSSEYVLKHHDRIMSAQYMPTKLDIIHSNMPTTGILTDRKLHCPLQFPVNDLEMSPSAPSLSSTSSATIEINPIGTDDNDNRLNFCLTSAGGSVTERKRWHKIIESRPPNAIVFVVSLVSFCQNVPSVRNPAWTQLHESLQSFEELLMSVIINDSILERRRHPPFLIVFNKLDLFLKCYQTFPQHWPSYHSSDVSPNAVMDYIRSQFIDIFEKSFDDYSHISINDSRNYIRPSLRCINAQLTDESQIETYHIRNIRQSVIDSDLGSQFLYPDLVDEILSFSVCDTFWDESFISDMIQTQ